MSGDLEAQHHGIETIPTVDILKTLIKDGQALTMTLAGPDFALDERGHWFSPKALLEMIEADLAQLSALRDFHDFFKDRCERLFEAFGEEPIDLYNKVRQQSLANGD